MVTGAEEANVQEDGNIKDLYQAERYESRRDTAGLNWEEEDVSLQKS